MKIPRRIIIERQFNLCLRCGKPLKNEHIHHIDRTGKSKNPNNSPLNLCALHKTCHDVVHLRFAFPGHLAKLETEFDLALFELVLTMRNKKIIQGQIKTIDEMKRLTIDFTKIKEMITTC